MASPDLTVIIPVAPSDRERIDLLRWIPPSWTTLVSAAEPAPEGVPPQLTWLHGPLGRGRQLNAGARAAKTRWLWFVHADSELMPGAAAAVAAWTSTRDQGLGYLNLSFLPDGPALTRLNALGANLRSRLFGLPYGDQALCVSRREFLALGGFREDLERGEDLDFVVRARSNDLPATRIPATIRTSARRYRDQGWLKTTLGHQLGAWRLIRQAGRRADQNSS